MNAYEKLDSHEKVLFLQVAANPGYQKLLLNQKEEIQQQLLNFWSLNKESDTDFRRRHEVLSYKLNFINEQIELYQTLLKQT